jgi:DNA-binding transcriptional regulator YhcF (GntR family)
MSERKKVRLSDEEIAKLYDEWKRSGLSVRQFAMSHGLPYTTIWRRFRRLETPEAPKRKSGTVPAGAVGRVILKDVGYIDIIDKYTYELAQEFLRIIAKKLGIGDTEQNRQGF